MAERREHRVEIDDKGVIQAVGPLAAQRLRARHGPYRLLPSPRHVVFLRLAEEGMRDFEDRALVRLAGEISEPGAIADVLGLVSQAGWHGKLLVSKFDDKRVIFCDHGNVIGVQTSAEDERLGSVLYKNGVLGQAELDKVEERMASGRRFAEAAMELGLLTPEQVFHYIGVQIEEVVYAAMTQSEGTFFFLDRFDESQLATRHSVSIAALLMNGVTRMDELHYFRQKIPSRAYVPVRVRGRLDPPAEYAQLYAVIDDSASVEELGRRTGKGEFQTTKQLYALVQSKHVVIYPPHVGAGPHALVELANKGLALLHADADQIGAGKSLRETLASFAIGAGVHGILLAQAGPDEAGKLEAQRVADNARVMTGGQDAENLLKQVLHEYLSFALFTVGTQVPSGREAELRQDLAPILQALRPIAQADPSPAPELPLPSSR
ncbi:MAG: DUF4388 domain-containing protein [Polyangiaceae bacterium]